MMKTDKKRAKRGIIFFVTMMGQLGGERARVSATCDMLHEPTFPETRTSGSPSQTHNSKQA